MSAINLHEPTAPRPALKTHLRAEERQQRAIQRAARQILRAHKKTRSQTERRQQGRLDFIQPVKVKLENQREMTLLSRDLSVSGIRLIGTVGLLGQKVEVVLQRGADQAPVRFLVRILWTCTIADGLFENGGTFLELVRN